MLSQWKQYFNHSDFETLIDFVNKTKNGQNWGNQQYIYLYCKSQSLKDKLINDICTIIGKDDCKYCKPNPYKPILKKNFKDEDDDDEDVDEDEYDTTLLDEHNLYINKKLLIFNEKIILKCPGFIKEVVGNDTMIYYNPIIGIEQINPICNIIVYADKYITMDSGLKRRTVFIKLNV